MIPPAASCRQGGFLSLTNTQIDRQTKPQTLPSVPYGGKARYGALEVALEGIGALCLSDVRVGKARWCALEGRLEGGSALCLHGSGEGKRGRMACRGLRRGSARFAYRNQRRESAVGCLGGTSGGARRALPQRELMKKKSSMYIKKATTLPERVGLKA